MKHTTFLSFSESLKKISLGGVSDHLEMIPEERKSTLLESSPPIHTKKAAVLALFYPNKDGETCLALTLRPTYSGTHSAQVSFPGGKKEVKDKNLAETALRETFEEIGIEQNEIETIREMTHVYIPPSNFLVTPFMAYTRETPIFDINHEVEKMIEVPINQLLDDSFVRYDTQNTFSSKNLKIPYFNFSNEKIWGATAMIISEIKELIKKL